MRTPPREDRRLRKLTEICVALPEVERTRCGEHADFRVCGKVFAYFLKSLHGDGIVSVCCKPALGEGVVRASQDPRRYYLPAYLGARGWFGIRLDLGNIDWHEVQNCVTRSYELAAQRTPARSSERPNRTAAYATGAMILSQVAARPLSLAVQPPRPVPPPALARRRP
jgi:predicted DNA-binding protein (MmcQ/YjbR family)